MPPPEKKRYAIGSVVNARSGESSSSFLLSAVVVSVDDNGNFYEVKWQDAGWKDWIESDRIESVIEGPRGADAKDEPSCVRRLTRNAAARPSASTPVPDRPAKRRSVSSLKNKSDTAPALPCGGGEQEDSRGDDAKEEDVERLEVRVVASGGDAVGRQGEDKDEEEKKDTGSCDEDDSTLLDIALKEKRSRGGGNGGQR